MPRTDYFAQNCPACGRRLHIRHEHADDQVACQHCCAEFKAQQPLHTCGANFDWRTDPMRRADELLALVGAGV